MREGLLFIVSLIILTSICDTINQLFLKSAINSLKLGSPINIGKIARFIVQLIMIPRVWLSFSFSLLSLCIWLFVLSRADLNFAFSVDSIHYVLIAFSSRWILREKVDPLRWLGTVMIVAGIILVALS